MHEALHQYTHQYTNYQYTDYQYTNSQYTDYLSVQVVMDEHGVSKGYGFVHFETQESADMAIQKVNGMLLNDKKV